MSDVSQNESIGGNASEEDRRVYLQMLQHNIDRMSNLSAAVKGLVIAIMAGILQVQTHMKFVSISHFVWFWIACVIIISFLAYFSRYYWFLEKCYRTTYNAVLTGKKTDYYDMNPFACICKSKSKYARLTSLIGIGGQFFIFVFIFIAIIIFVSSMGRFKSNDVNQNKPEPCQTKLDVSIHLEGEPMVR